MTRAENGIGFEIDIKRDKVISVGTKSNTRDIAGAIAGEMRRLVGIPERGRLRPGDLERFPENRGLYLRSMGETPVNTALEAIIIAKKFLESDVYKDVVVGFQPEINFHAENVDRDIERANGIIFRIFLHKRAR